MQGLPEVPGVSHRRVRAGAIEMHVAEAGEGPPLLLVHGWPQHWYAWRALIPELALEHRVICPDLRGLGWSDAPPGGYDKATLAGDLLNLMDALGLERASLAGHDWGGYAGYLLAQRAPERIERLAMLSIVTPGATRPRRVPSPWAPLLMAYQVVLATPVLGPLTLTAGSALLHAIFATWPRRELEDVDVYAERLKDPARARATSLYYRTFLTRELPSELRGRHPGGEPVMPVLRLMGEHDFLRKLAGDEPGVKLIAGAGHFLPEEAPQEVLEALRAFLNDEEPPSGGSPQRRSVATRSR
jgi:pimeloyl-ACP methyl ester carboxylesterase